MRLRELKKLEVYQECKDGRLDTAIEKQLLEDGIINKDEYYNMQIIFFNKNRRRNGKFLVSIDGEIFAVTEIFRFNTEQRCVLRRIKDIGTYIPE